MTTSMMKPIDYLFLRWPSVIALVVGILVATVVLLFVSIQQSGAQTVEPGQHYIAAGDFHSLGASGSGGGPVYAWGKNVDGQIGNGDYNPYNGVTTPARVTSSLPGNPIVVYLGNIKDVAGGARHTLAIGTNGDIFSWGDDSWGQLGNGQGPIWDVDYREYAQGPLGLCGKSVAAGEDHSLALDCNGAVWAWGRNNNGQLGTGTVGSYSDATYVPVQVKGPDGEGNLTGVTAIAAGDNHNLALKSDGTLYAWGDNSDGQLGLGSSVNNKGYPVQVWYLYDVVAIAAGAHHSMAVESDGSVYAWGDDSHGQLGDGGGADHLTPVQVEGPGGVGYLDLGELTGTQEDLATVAAGELHSLALKNDGTAVYAWGEGGKGQLGIHSNNDHTVPYQVHGPGNGQPPDNGLSGITDVAAGEHHSLALKNDGTVWAWGGGAWGQLGIHSDNDHTVPYQVHGVGNVGYLTGIGQPSASSPPGGYPPDEHPPDEGTTPSGGKPTAEKSAICHKANTPHEKTLYVPESALKGHLRHGDEEDSCE